MDQSCLAPLNLPLDVNKEDYEVVYMIGSEYETRWNLCKGEYQLFNSKSKGLIFYNGYELVEIGKGIIKNYGLRTCEGEESIYFLALGSRSAYGEGELTFRCASDLEIFEEWILAKLKHSSKKRSDLKKSKLNRHTMSYQDQSLQKKSQLNVQLNSLSLDNLLKSPLGNKKKKKGSKNFFQKIFFGKKKKSKSKTDENNVSTIIEDEDYSLIDELNEEEFYKPRKSVSSVTSNFSSAPTSPINSTISKKWHEKDEIYSEYDSEFLVPITHTQTDKIKVMDSGDIYSLVTKSSKKKVKSNLRESVGDYYNDAKDSHEYINCD